jgi:SagB-type dehydrogenase family enzyme
LQRLVATAQKTYASARRVKLPTQLPPACAGFDEVVLGRRSSRQFGRQPLTLADVAKLLHLAYGITGVADGDQSEHMRFRAAPSGGALYPLELYALPLRVARLSPGVYHFHPGDHALEELVRGSQRSPLERLTHMPEIGAASLVIAVTGIPAKTRIKYGERGYRFMLLEAGHVAQNVLLTAQAQGLAAVAIGGFVDSELDDVLGIDGVDEVSLYLLAIGPTPASDAQ